MNDWQSLWTSARKAWQEGNHLDAIQTMERTFALSLQDGVLAAFAIGSEFVQMLSLSNRKYKALEVAQHLCQLAEDTDEPWCKCIAFESFGDLLSVLGERAEARKWLKRAAEIAEELTDPHTQCIAFLSFGDLLRVLGERAEARKWLKRAAEIAEELPDPHTQCNAFLSFGNLLRVLGEMAEARKWLKRAAEIAEELPDSHTQCNAFGSFGDLLRVLGEMAEARKWLKRALNLITPDSDPVLVCNVHRCFGELEYAERQWDAASRHAKGAGDAVFRWLAFSRNARSVGQLMLSYNRIFEIGIQSLDADGELADLNDDPVYFGDGGKTIALRERMRRRKRGDKPVPNWRATSQIVEGLFQPLPAETLQMGAQPRRLRGLRRGKYDEATLHEWIHAMLAEIAAAVDDESPSTEYTRAATLADCTRLLPDDKTVIILSMAAEGDLLYLPIRLNKGRPTVVRTNDGGFFRVVGGVTTAHEMELHLDSVLEVAQDALDCSPWTSGTKQFTLEDANLVEVQLRNLQIEELMGLIEPDPLKLATLNVVFIPDGPLYRLPVHATLCSDGRYLYEHVASFRYALSVSTLLLQQDINDERREQEQADRRLRGVAFGCPAIKFKPLPGVRRETEVLVEESPGSWWLHGDAEPEDQQSLLRRFDERHASGNVVVSMGHGLCGGRYWYTVRDRSEVIDIPPSFLMEDGLLDLARSREVANDFSDVLLMYFSSCLLGRIEGVGGGELEGFIASLAQQGARRVLSALWPLADDMAPEFTRHLVKALRTRYFDASDPSPHAFALAYKDAIDAFRKADPKHNHPYFWAPYVLHGLG